MRSLLLAFVLFVSPVTAMAQSCPPTFPADAKLVCHEGQLYVVSLSAQQAIPLPVSCV